MEPTQDVNQDSSLDQVVVPTSEGVKTPNEPAPVKTEEKVVPYERFKEVLEENKALKSQPAQSSQKSDVDALDFIKLGKKLQDYDDAEIDFATQFAKSKSPEAILAALEDEFVKTGIEARREKLQREKAALAPTSAQSEADRPKTFTEKLASASSPDIHKEVAEKERLLAEAGLYKAPKRRPDATKIGTQG
jgi:hypothetical protein